MKKVIVFVVFFLGGLWFINNFSYKPAPKLEMKKENIQNKIKTPSEILKEQMRDKYYEGIVFLKKNMKDPSSFEVDEAYALPNMTICYKYRAKNSFGALDVGYAILVNDTVFVREKMQPKAFEQKLKEECKNPLAVKMK
jgi:hypothetical protein